MVEVDYRTQITFGQILEREVCPKLQFAELNLNARNLERLSNLEPGKY